jgi:hypothetical protein
MHSIVLAPLAADGRQLDVYAMSFLLFAIYFRFGRTAGMKDPWP